MDTFKVVVSLYLDIFWENMECDWGTIPVKKIVCKAGLQVMLIEHTKWKPITLPESVQC